MSELSDQVSDGSDIEIDDEVNLDELIINDRINTWQNPDNDEWLRFMEVDDESDNEFYGFDGEQACDGFGTHQRRLYSYVGGAFFDQLEEARPIHYFSLFWGDDLWQLFV